jgi:acyl-CoA synthetase (AMP-forming)/AMP-acid ligase II
MLWLPSIWLSTRTTERRTTNARLDDEPAADDFRAAAARRAEPQRYRDRFPPAGRAAPTATPTSDAHRRSRQLARVLLSLGVKAEDRIGTLAWNTHRHFEIYFAVSGMAAICHTINPRLFPEQITYIANHADDRFVFFDVNFAGLVEALVPHCPGVKGWVAMCGRDEMPANAIPNLHCYEELLAAQATTTNGRSSTRTPPRRCATPRAPPATPRACSTRTAPRCCTPTVPACPTASAPRRATASCRWCRCSTSMPGACPMPAR